MKTLNLPKSNLVFFSRVFLGTLTFWALVGCAKFGNEYGPGGVPQDSSGGLEVFSGRKTFRVESPKNEKASQGSSAQAPAANEATSDFNQDPKAKDALKVTEVLATVDTDTLQIFIEFQAERNSQSEKYRLSGKFKSNEVWSSNEFVQVPLVGEPATQRVSDPLGLTPKATVACLQNYICESIAVEIWFKSKVGWRKVYLETKLPEKLKRAGVLPHGDARADHESERDSSKGTDSEEDFGQIIDNLFPGRIVLAPPVGVDLGRNRPKLSFVKEAVGFYNKGSLRRWVGLPISGQGYKIKSDVYRRKKPKNFGNTNMSRFLKDLGRRAAAAREIRAPLTYGGISKEAGGKVGHLSHQNGLDADIGFVSRSGYQNTFQWMRDARGIRNGDFDSLGTWKLLQLIAQSGRKIGHSFRDGEQAVWAIFLSRPVRKVICEEARKDPDYPFDKGSLKYEAIHLIYDFKDHEDHFHVRLKCLNNEACRTATWSKSRKQERGLDRNKFGCI